MKPISLASHGQLDIEVLGLSPKADVFLRKIGVTTIAELCANSYGDLERKAKDHTCVALAHSWQFKEIERKLHGFSNGQLCLRRW